MIRTTMLVACLVLSACATVPDVRPYGAATTAFVGAAGAGYAQTNAQIQAYVPGDTLPKSKAQEVDGAKAQFAATGKLLDALLAAMVDYAEQVVVLVQSGESGDDAAASLMETWSGFTTLVGFAAPISDALAGIFKRVAEEFTRRQAVRSLEEAMAAAEPGLEATRQAFAQIYGQALPQANDALRNLQRLDAAKRVGLSVVGFRTNVLANYDAYYRQLNGLVAPVGGRAWQGFCQPDAANCQAIAELQAVGLVDARMAAIRPELERYDAQLTAIEAAHAQRAALYGATLKAMNAWIVEHQKVRRALRTGTGVTASRLHAALEELRATATPPAAD